MVCLKNCPWVLQYRVTNFSQKIGRLPGRTKKDKYRSDIEHNMKGEYVRIWTEDGIELQGLFCESKTASNKAILHIHGLAGNFYENRFIDYIADEIVNRGYNFLTVNTRGHDYLSDFLKKSDHELTYVQIGCMHEILKECVFDIRGWINFLSDRGCSKIALEGHTQVRLRLFTIRAN